MQISFYFLWLKHIKSYRYRWKQKFKQLFYAKTCATYQIQPIKPRFYAYFKTPIKVGNIKSRHYFLNECMNPRKYTTSIILETPRRCFLKIWISFIHFLYRIFANLYWHFQNDLILAFPLQRFWFQLVCYPEGLKWGVFSSMKIILVKIHQCHRRFFLKHEYGHKVLPSNTNGARLFP